MVWLMAGVLAAGPSLRTPISLTPPVRSVRTDLGRAIRPGSRCAAAPASLRAEPPHDDPARGQRQVGGPVGPFDFVHLLKQAFEELPGLFEALLGAGAESLPMLVCAMPAHAV